MVRTKAGFRGGSRLLQTVIAAALLAPGAALAALEYNLQPPVTPIARQIIDLHSFIFWVCVVIFVVVFGVMFYSIFKHRKSVGHVAEQFHENTTVEVVWTVIPFLILLFMAFPATKMTTQNHMMNTCRSCICAAIGDTGVWKLTSRAACAIGGSAAAAAIASRGAARVAASVIRRRTPPDPCFIASLLTMLTSTPWFPVRWIAGRRSGAPSAVPARAAAPSRRPPPFPPLRRYHRAVSRRNDRATRTRSSGGSAAPNSIASPA